MDGLRGIGASTLAATTGEVAAVVVSTTAALDEAELVGGESLTEGAGWFPRLLDIIKYYLNAKRPYSARCRPRGTPRALAKEDEGIVVTVGTHTRTRTRTRLTESLHRRRRAPNTRASLPRTRSYIVEVEGPGSAYVGGNNEEESMPD